LTFLRTRFGTDANFDLTKLKQSLSTQSYHGKGICFSAVLVHDFVTFPYKEVQAERLILLNVRSLMGSAVNCGRMTVITTNDTVLLGHPLYVKSKIASPALKRYMTYNIARHAQRCSLLTPTPNDLETKSFKLTVYRVALA
jgi:hypothetical protein